ncbi:MAG: TonB-dependent receptor [Bacteroidales bacterium]
MRNLTSAFVLVSCCTSSLFAQQVNVKGVILDAKTKDPIIGASVIETGSTNGVITNIDGEFILQLPANGEIQVNYVGYKPYRAAVEGRAQITIFLEEDLVNLEEVVVLGYGQESRKSNLSVAISKKEIGDDVKSRSTSIMGALQGQIAGVTIASNSGDPMSKPSVTIRGKGSRDGESPLYVVDGVAGAPFNAEDVEQITILKDAASAAIYGSNVGSGGVILVTTKKAKEGKIAVSARAGYGVQSVWRKPSVLNAAEYVKVRTDAALVDGVSIPAGINPNIYSWGGVTRTNWVDEIFRTGNMQRYALSLNGGSETLKAYTSVEYSKNEGTLLNTYSENLGAKANLDFKINKWISVSERINFVYTNGQGGINTSSHTGVTAAAMFMPPSATVYETDKEGNFVLDKDGNKQFGGTVPLWAKELGVAGTFGEVQNPVASLMRLNQNRPTHELFSTTSLNLSPVNSVKIRSEFSAGTNNEYYEEFNARIPEIGKTKDENSRTLATLRENKWLWETVASYDQGFNKHRVSAMAGYSMSYKSLKGFSLSVYNFPDEDKYAQNIVNGSDWSKTKPSEQKSEEAQISAFARGSYSYADRYFMTASIRRDASSKLYQKNNSGIFPAVSGAWKISSEKFMADVEAISLLKLRASWGQIGNVAGVRNYSYISNLAQTGDYTYLGNMQQNPILGLGLISIPNKNLKWETSEQTDLGFDIELLKGKLTLAADYFIKNTKDLIDEVPVASVAGISVAPLGNVGKVKNSGYELTVGYQDATPGGFVYKVDANFTRLKSKVIDLGERDFLAHSRTIRGMQPLRSKVGEDWYSYFVIETDGIFQSQEEINAYSTTTQNGSKKLIQPNAQPGDLKFKDANGDGIINEDDRVFKGSYTPKFTYGLNASFSYKNFDLGLSLQGVGGNKIFNGVKVMTYAAGQGWNMSSDVLDSWAYNKNSDIPLVSMTDKNGNFSTVSDFFLEDGDYLRLKNLTLGYTMPKKLFGKTASAPQLRMYVSGENLLTLTKYSGMDPEVGNYGIDGGTYPVSRVVSFGLNLSF